MIVATTAGGALLAVVGVRELIVGCALLSLVVIAAVGRVLWTVPDDEPAGPARAADITDPLLLESLEGGAAA